MTFVLPPSELATPLLRTDYASDDRWRALLAAIAVPNSYGFLASVTVVEDRRLDGLDDAAVRRLPARDTPLLLLVADAAAQASDDFPLLVVDTMEGRPSFRVTAACLWAVQNNLSLGNADWEDFSDNLGADRVFRDC